MDPNEDDSKSCQVGDFYTKFDIKGEIRYECDLLPEIVWQIMLFSSMNDLYRMFQVCCTWGKISLNANFWSDYRTSLLGGIPDPIFPPDSLESKVKSIIDANDLYRLSELKIEDLKNLKKFKFQLKPNLPSSTDSEEEKKENEDKTIREPFELNFLMYATIKNRLEIVKHFLTDEKRNIFPLREKRADIWSLACLFGRVEILKYLISMSDKIGTLPIYSNMISHSFFETRFLREKPIKRLYRFFFRRDTYQIPRWSGMQEFLFSAPINHKEITMRCPLYSLPYIALLLNDYDVLKVVLETRLFDDAILEESFPILRCCLKYCMFRALELLLRHGLIRTTIGITNLDDALTKLIESSSICEKLKTSLAKVDEEHIKKGGDFPFFVRNKHNQRIFRIRGAGSDTVMNLKTRIRDQIGVPEDMTKLGFPGASQLENDRTMTEYGIDRGAILFLGFKIGRGG